jgi:hypothetical protein
MSDVSTDSPVLQIPLAPRDRGFCAIVDPIDSDLAEMKWSLLHVRTTPYAQRRANIDGKYKNHYLHRVIMCRMLDRQLSRWELVDHIDKNGLNCKRENLRLATNTQNLRNRGKQANNTTGYKGVRPNRNKNKAGWAAMINIGGDYIYLGTFPDIKAAARAYNDAALKYHGDFAYLNVIPED